MLVLSIHFPMPLLVPSDGLGVAWGWSGAALGWLGATLAWPGGWRGDWSGLPGGGLGVAWDDFTIRELSGNYPGTIRDLGWAGWPGLAAGWLGCVCGGVAFHPIIL